MHSAIAPDNLLALGLAGAFGLTLTLGARAKELPSGGERRQVIASATVTGALAVLFGGLLVAGVA